METKDAMRIDAAMFEWPCVMMIANAANRRVMLLCVEVPAN